MDCIIIKRYIYGVSNNFKKFLVVINENSTNIKRSLKRLDEMSRIKTNKEIIMAHLSNDLTKNNDILHKNKDFLGPNTVVCIAGGDGTVSFVIDKLVTDSRLNEDQKKSLILPLWGGNANDLAYMLNGLSWRKSLKKVLEKSKPVEIYPLILSTNYRGKRSSQVAVCYVSFGASALFAKKLNDPENRKNLVKRSDSYRLAMEFNQFIKSFFKYDLSKIEKDGEDIQMFEFLILNGSRLAKVERVPIKITGKDFYSVLYNNKKPSFVATEILKIIGKKEFGEKTSRPIEFVAKQNLWAQYDGEVKEIKKGTKVKIKKRAKPFRALSIKL